MKKTISFTEAEFRELLAEAVVEVIGGKDNGSGNRSLSDEQSRKDDEAMKRVEEHNRGKDMDGTRYIISVTGAGECYYTLYLFSKPILDAGFSRNPYIYRGNLSQSFSAAVDKVLSRVTNLGIEVMPEGELLNKIRRYKKEVFKGGKYAGKSVEEVYSTDPRYILWYYDKLVEESGIRKTNPHTGHTYYLTKGQHEMLELLKGYVATYHEEQIKSRRESIDSEHEEGGSLEGLRFEVIMATQKVGFYGPYVEIRGKNGNKYYVVYKSGEMSDREVSSVKGRTVTIVSAKTQPIEIYGVKYNKLSSVKGFKIE
jgi:hypothetical protein